MTPVEPVKVLAPGLTLDAENNLHFYPKQWLKAKKLPLTKEAEDAACAALKEVFREKNARAPIIELFEGSTSMSA